MSSPDPIDLNLTAAFGEEATALARRINVLLTAVIGQPCPFVLIWAKPAGASKTALGSCTNTSEEGAVRMMMDILETMIEKEPTKRSLRQS